MSEEVKESPAAPVSEKKSKFRDKSRKRPALGTFKKMHTVLSSSADVLSDDERAAFDAESTDHADTSSERADADVYFDGEDYDEDGCRGVREDKKADRPQERFVLLQVKFMNQLQKFRIALNNQICALDDHTVDGVLKKNINVNDVKIFKESLSPQDVKEMRENHNALELLERRAASAVARAIRPIPIWNHWLKHQRGVGPRTAGFLIAETDIRECNTVSQLWSWYGLGLVGSSIQKRRRGEVANFSPFRKSKVLEVLGGSLMKQKSEPWYSHYKAYRHRKSSQQVPACMRCNGVGTVTYENKRTQEKTAVKCPTCDGAPGPKPWGCSEYHRHRAALRYMVKMFLQEFWRQWRTLEGLPVPPPYSEAYLTETHPGPARSKVHKFSTPGGCCPHCRERLIPEVILPQEYIVVPENPVVGSLAPACPKCKGVFVEV